MEEERARGDFLPISPLLSAASTPDSTQLPISSRKGLQSRGVTEEEIEVLTAKYNRRVIAVVDDDSFYQRLCEIADAVGRNHLESEVSRWIHEEGTRIDRDCLKAKLSISLLGLGFLQTKNQKQSLIAGLKYDHTIHGYEQMIAYTLPFLIENLAEHKKMPRRRPARGARRFDKHPPCSDSEHKGLRRSARISRQSARRYFQE